ncbi:MAG: ATP-binding cassette domain-containing protein, partial [Rhizobiales bacterium]|nr:ATP-binding cassette domain-containing protein [Hyphomicrobiales bacterium]
MGVSQHENGLQPAQSTQSGASGVPAEPAVSVPDLALAPGTLAGVVGANGAGKTTLVNGILGWSRGPARVTGTVRLDGYDLGPLAVHARVRRGLLLVPEGLAVFGTMSVEENLR